MRPSCLLCLCALSLFARPVPIAFEPNQGQAASGVDFLAHAAGFTLALHSGSAEFLARGAHVTATLAGARPSLPQPEDRLPGTVTYLVGQAESWRRDLPTYGRVKYRGVYPGIDVVYYGKGGTLEYDFAVAPDADPRQIRIGFSGARGLKLDAQGDLIIDTPAGPLRQRRPALYQDVAGVRRPVEGRYLLHGNTLRLRTGAYDRRLPLVIDPALTWATYAGTTLADESRAVTTDSAGNVYLTGSSLSTRGDTDVFVVKLDGSGNLVKRVLLGGTDGDDDGYGIAVDSTGAVYVAGESGSFQWAITTTYAGLGNDAFYAKVDAAFANYVYAAFFGGNGDDVVFSCALDANNNLFLGGATLSTNLPVTRTGPQRTLAGGIDGFLAQVDPTGKPVYTTYVGGAGDDYVFGIALDAAGNLYATGQTASTDLPTTAGAFQMASGGGLDAFAAKYAASGSVTWLTYLGGTGDDDANAIAVDSSGNVVVAGGTKSTNFPVAAAYQAANAGGARDMFVTKLSPDGAKLLWSTYLGGSGDELANGVGLDVAGNVYVAGTSNSTDFPSLGAFQAANRGNADGTITALAADGRTIQFSSYIGGSGNDFTEGVNVSCAAGVVITGTSASNNFPATLGTANLNYAQGATSGWVAKVGAGTAATVIAAGGIVNAATSASAPVAPGSLVSIYGTNLAGTTAAASSTPLGTTLGGATVTVNGSLAPLIYVSPGQINFQLPYEAGPGTATATVNGGCGQSAPVSFAVTAAAPYLLPGAGGDALVQNQDFTFNSATNAAPKGSVVTVYMIGMGAPDAAVATGAATPSDRYYQTPLPKSATIGGVDAPVQFLGLTPTFVGLVQANLVVPNLNPGKYPIVVTVNGVDSNAATMYVK